jgi:hypothetical protein
LLNLGRCNIAGIDTAYATTFVMDLQHDLSCLFSPLAEELLQNPTTNSIGV